MMLCGKASNSLTKLDIGLQIFITGHLNHSSASAGLKSVEDLQFDLLCNSMIIADTLFYNGKVSGNRHHLIRTKL